jgi:hypothetical protein
MWWGELITYSLIPVTLFGVPESATKILKTETQQ